MRGTTERSRAKRPKTDRTGPPDFLVIGAMRAGTTTLHNMLAAHPAVSVPRIKETDYFLGDAAFKKGEAWYTSLFDTKAEARGEVSPNYTKRDVFPGVPERVEAHAPQTRLIYLVRDPVSRAISHFQHAVASGAPLRGEDDLFDHAEGQHILATSRYGYQLEPWEAALEDGRLMVLDFDLLRATPDVAMERVCTHIGVAPTPGAGSSTTQANTSADVASRPAWWMQLRASKLGLAVRQAVPEGMAETLKRTFAPRGPTPEPILFSDAAKARAAALLKDDIDRFRSMTGQKFEHWSV